MKLPAFQFYADDFVAGQAAKKGWDFRADSLTVNTCFPKVDACIDLVSNQLPLAREGQKPSRGDSVARLCTLALGVFFCA